MKIVTFDIDDTLVFTFENAFQKTKEAWVIMWFPPLSMEQYLRYYWKLTYEECIANYFPWVDIGEFNLLYTRLRDIFPYRPIPWGLPIIHLARKIRWSVWIITNGSEDKTYRKLQCIWIDGELLKIFRFVLHWDNLWNYKKPSSEAFSRVLEEFDPKDITHIWDSPEDLWSARWAWVEFYGVLTGYTRREVFRKLDLDSSHILESVHSFKNKLK